MSKKQRNETIIAAVKANRGGLTTATDAQVMTLWQSLDAATQKRYLESMNERNEPHATGNQSQQKI